jgi:hypothetical protein
VRSPPSAPGSTRSPCPVAEPRASGPHPPGRREPDAQASRDGHRTGLGAPSSRGGCADARHGTGSDTETDAEIDSGIDSGVANGVANGVEVEEGVLVFVGRFVAPGTVLVCDGCDVVVPVDGVESGEVGGTVVRLEPRDTVDGTARPAVVAPGLLAAPAVLGAAAALVVPGPLAVEEPGAGVPVAPVPAALDAPDPLDDGAHVLPPSPRAMSGWTETVVLGSPGIALARGV